MVGTNKKPQRRSVSHAKRVSSKLPAETDASPAYKRKNTKAGYENRAKTRYGQIHTGKPSTSNRTRIRWPQFVFLFLLLSFVLSVGLFVWDRWFRFDDVQDFQGQWILEQTAQPVAIDGEKIALSSELDYSYTLDTWNKTILYTFSDLEGSGKYRFSPDRQKLVVIEGGTDDWMLYVKIALGLADPAEGAEGTGTTILLKTASSPIDPSDSQDSDNTQTPGDSDNLGDSASEDANNSEADTGEGATA